MTLKIRQSQAFRLPTLGLILVLVLGQIIFLNTSFGSDHKDVSKFSEIQADLEKQIEQNGINNVLLVLDVDNTLLTMKDDLGSQNWVLWQLQLLDRMKACQHAKIAQDESAASCLTLFKSRGLVAKSLNGIVAARAIIFEHFGMHPTESSLPSAIKSLQKRGLRVIAITTRHPQMRMATHQELVGNNYNLKFKKPLLKDQWLHSLRPLLANQNTLVQKYGFNQSDLHNLFPSSINPSKKQSVIPKDRPVLFADGVFFTSGYNKGAMLQILYRHLKTKPKSIFFVDNDVAQTESVWSAFFGRQLVQDINVYRYSHEDSRSQKFQAKNKAFVSATWNQFYGSLKANKAQKKSNFSDLL